MKELAAILAAVTLGVTSLEIGAVAAERFQKLSGVKSARNCPVCNLPTRCTGVTYTTATAR
jgi:hypothetical protein